MIELWQAPTQLFLLSTCLLYLGFLKNGVYKRNEKKRTIYVPKIHTPDRR